MEPEPSHLPVELLDKIFFHLRHDHPSLASCSRVCQFWRPSAERYLYAEVRIGKFKEYPHATTRRRSLRGGLKVLRMRVLETSSSFSEEPSLCKYIQRLDIAWHLALGLDVASLRSLVSTLPNLRILAVWHTLRSSGSPDSQILAFDGLRSERASSSSLPSCSTSGDRPLLVADHTWVSLHSEVITLTRETNTVQPFLNVLGVIDATDTLYIMISRRLVIDQSLQHTLRFPTSFRDIRTLELAFDTSGWFSSRPNGVLLGLLAESRPRSLRCIRWRYPIHARTVGTVMQQVGGEVEHLHIYLRHFMGDTWSDLHLSSCPRLHTIHFTDFWTWFEASDAQHLFNSFRRDAPQIRELVFASTMRDLPEKSYETQPQIQWSAIDELLAEEMTTYTMMEKVTVELEAFLPGVRKTLQKMIRARLPKTYKRGLIRFMLESGRRVRHALESCLARRELPLAALSRCRAQQADGLTPFGPPQARRLQI
ncbi:hypothetical protein BDY19DRAFT_996177 [Irpex rosettiformis]|uniref:Uncharacterized protein n=1 Tax=Irpex rosettiformis TaxID=378272 RepID=A0ACB8TVE8_9APHY|nr:hypothetical protein BDY19DRAFT_996177 [Irpex rosettiformis]